MITDAQFAALEARVAALEGKNRKAPDVSNAKPINLRKMESEVADGEMFSFAGKYFWSENKGKMTKVAFSPLDAERNEKCGKFFACWESLPTWLEKGMACNVVAQRKDKPPYVNWNIASIAPMTQAMPIPANDPQWIDDTPEPVAQTFVSDEEAGVDPANIPF